MPLEHRLQILIDDERHRRITALARERGVRARPRDRADATAVATAYANLLSPLLTVRHGFSSVSGIDHVIPDAAGVARLLA